MLLKKTAWFWKSGLAAISFMLIVSVSGCSDTPQEETAVVETISEVQLPGQKDEEETEKMIECCLELYEKAAEENKIADLEMIRSIVNRFGENGYPAVDSRNQIDMTEAEQVEWFCEMVDTQEEAEITIIEVSYLGGFVKYDLETKDGNVDVVRSYYKYENGNMKREVTGSYQAEYWNYTEDGYLMFSGVWFSEELYVLTLSGAEEHTALRVQPLDETYRELSRKYLLPIGFEQNNMFIVDWSEDDFGDLNFYDMYDLLYPKVNGTYTPYVADDNLGVGAVYRIPKDDFESVIMAYFNIDSETLQSKALGKRGLVSVEEDTAMQNHEAIEAFYADYLDGQDSMVTVFEVQRDGLIGAVTFIYRKGELQTYYIGIRWREGGMPEIQGTSVSNVAEIKLTEKGYFIYAYEYVIAHASLRQYWRIEPLPEDCRKLTEKYISGLSYVNYNVLVTNWDSNNVEDILMPCMYEDIYRIYTGENLKTEDWKISAEEFEKIMTTYFPVSVEQLREHRGYDEGSNSYEYEMIYASPYPPFGEVVDYTENADGTITLIVDGVWPDYNSDLAFRNTVVVQPFEDGTFRYLSNSIEQIELELPPIARTKG